LKINLRSNILWLKETLTFLKSIGDNFGFTGHTKNNLSLVWQPEVLLN